MLFYISNSRRLPDMPHFIILPSIVIYRHTDSDSWTCSKALVTGENVLGCCGDEHLKRCLNDLEVSSLMGSRTGKGLHVIHIACSRRGHEGHSQGIFLVSSGWWFHFLFVFTPTWGNDPIWLIFFKWVETTT